MENLLIAVRSEALTAALSDILTQYHVHICHSGPKAVEMIDTIRPKLLILDLRLPDLDGLSVLSRAGYTPPVILALADIVTDTVLHRAHLAGVDSLVLIPCSARHVAERLNELVQNKATSPGT